MKLIRSIMWSIVIAFLAYFLTLAAADWYVDQLKSSGGFVTAKDLVGAKWMPGIVALLAGIGTLMFLNDKSNQ